MSTGKLTSYLSPVTAIAGATLNGLTVGSYAWGAEFDNSTNLYPYATVSLGLSGAAATGTAPSYVSFWLVEPDDLGNYPYSSGNPGGSPVATFWCPANTFQFTGRLLINRLMPPKGKIVAQNNMGTSGTFPANSLAACSLHFFADSLV